MEMDAGRDMRIKIDAGSCAEAQLTIKHTEHPLPFLSSPVERCPDSFASLNVPFDKFLIKFAFNGETNVAPNKGKISPLKRRFAPPQ